MKKSITIYLIAAMISLMLPMVLCAQQNPDPNAPPPPNDAPIDGGLSLLVAAGAAYGVKKYRAGKKKHEQDAGEDLK